VTALAQSPAVDVIGVGYDNGLVRVLDIRQSELVMQVKMDDGPITAVCFRMGELSDLFTFTADDKTDLLSLPRHLLPDRSVFGT
jgi:hypothetical protein